MYSLRGHHLLCLLGYEGMGYSKEYADNMTFLHQSLRKHPEQDISIVEGPDDLCAHFPPNVPHHCTDTNVAQRDRAILEKLDLRVGTTLPWSDILRRISSHIHSTQLPAICSTCPWLSYGTCQRGLQRVNQGEEPLIEL
ncbi:DUF1284 domain-containing protein [Alicyclobacillus sp. SP_1]|uniref:DUF1284 domain-containing protein n=1 Tax=Alicyclobacillus sp. SP_1 TaxID=2942475 RepID=UPI0028037E03|nr:DUF1284 domain-containing protein [Alicyclobacillus sp. SP_1]